MDLKFSLTLIFCIAIYALGALASEHQLDNDIRSILQARMDKDPTGTAKAISILTYLDSTSPSCGRLAGQDLVKDCQSLKVSKLPGRRQPEAQLDRVRSVFAVRNAVCELKNANADISKECITFIPESPGQPRSGFTGWFTGSKTEEHPDEEYLEFPPYGEADLGKCLKQLGTQPQSWTSYSNNLQNAVVVCQASRHEVEQRENVAVFRRLFSTIPDLNSAFERIIKDLHQRNKEQEQFATLVQKWEKRSMDALELYRQQSGSTVERLTEEIQNGIASLMQGAQQVSSVLQDALKNARRVGGEVNAMRDNSLGSLQDLAQAGTEQATRHIQELNVSRNIAKDVIKSIELVNVLVANNLTFLLGDMNVELLQSHNLASKNHELQRNMAEQMETLEQALNSLHSSAVKLQAAVQETTTAFRRLFRFAGAVSVIFEYVFPVTLLLSSFFFRGVVGKLVLIAAGMGFLLTVDTTNYVKYAFNAAQESKYFPLVGGLTFLAALFGIVSGSIALGRQFFVAGTKSGDDELPESEKV
ncbi:hypothetical protein M501DRAFT_1059074 [Patellaria atrata CBS 101060]|uniref:Karyogamy protein 5 n=1 Tax=Patellaria atrata CBS 101060 TaxID=1346257 RepID=A0A9P4VLI8_9PEZI|nr:hypothetical protein M501DRAFT_1059074 [Patellaria atrata CBS 101060]